MDEEKPKKKRKKAAAEGEGGEPKVHKPNWREVYATVEEIKAFLADHIYLRWNLVKHRVEARLPMEDTFCVNSELAQFVSDDWQPMSDRLKNTLFTALQTVKSTRKTDFETVLDSGYVKGFHPFLYYLNRLPPWDGQDYILELSVSVSVKGGTDEQLYFYELLKRWLVGMVASWLDEDTVNHAGIFAQAYALYRQGFRHYFTKAEEERLKAHNRTFETPCSEQEAISKHFRLPNGGEHGEFYTATDIQLVISEGPALRFPVEKIGSAMKVLGFAGYRSHGRRGYRVVRYKIDEIEANRRLLASDAEPENETAGDSGDSAF